MILLIHPFVRRVGLVALCALLELLRYYLGLNRAVCSVLPMLLVLGYQYQQQNDEQQQGNSDNNNKGGGGEATMVVVEDLGLNVVAGMVTGLAFFPKDPPYDFGVVCVVWALLMGLDLLNLLPASVSEVGLRITACALALTTLMMQSDAPISSSGGQPLYVDGLGFAVLRGLLFAAAEGRSAYANRETMRCFGPLLFAPTALSLLICCLLLFAAQHASSLTRNELDPSALMFLPIIIQTNDNNNNSNGNHNNNNNNEQCSSSNHHPASLYSHPFNNNGSSNDGNANTASSSRMAPQHHHYHRPPPFLVVSQPLAFPPPKPSSSSSSSSQGGGGGNNSSSCSTAAMLVDSLDVKEAFRLAQQQYLCAHPTEEKNA